MLLCYAIGYGLFCFWAMVCYKCHCVLLCYGMRLCNAHAMLCCCVYYVDVLCYDLMLFNAAMLYYDAVMLAYYIILKL